MDKTKLWIITEMFYPNETSTAFILTEYAKALSEKYEVHVICSRDKANRNNDLPQVKIHDVFCPKLSKERLISRILKFLVITWCLSWFVIRRCRKGDKVLTVTNPATFILLVPWLKKINRFNLTILVHDVFPENTIPAGLLKKDSLLYGCIKKLFDKAYSKADRLIVLGRDMKKVMHDKTQGKVKIDIIENWAEEIISQKNYSSNQYNNKPEIIIQYAGNIGRVQGIERFISIFSRIKNKNLKFIIFGSGACSTAIKDYIHTNNIINIELRGPYQRSQQQEILSSADISLITLAPGMYGLGVPSKTYNIMAIGNPILYIGDKSSEIDCVINDANCGWCFSPSDEKQIAEFLDGLSCNSLELEIREKGKNAAEFCAKHFSKHLITEKIKTIL